MRDKSSVRQRVPCGTFLSTLAVVCILVSTIGCGGSVPQDDVRAIENRLRIVLERATWALQQNPATTATDSWTSLSAALSGNDPVFRYALLYDSRGSFSPLLGNSDMHAWRSPDDADRAIALMSSESVKQSGRAVSVGISFSGDTVYLCYPDKP